MSAELLRVLREAAALMRERAKAASPHTPWTIIQPEDGWVGLRQNLDYGPDIARADLDGDPESEFDERVAADFIHIAAFASPDVALAVADWLDTAGADLWAHGPLCECGSGCHACDDVAWQPHVRRALAVARAYLSADSG